MGYQHTVNNVDKVASKKRKKWLVPALTVLIALIIVLASFILMGANSADKKQYQEKISQEVQEFTDQQIEELDQVDTSEEGLRTNALENNTASPEAVPSGVKSEAEKQVIGEELKKLEDERKQQILQALSVTYSEDLEQQKQEAFRLAEELISQGKADWAALVKKGENTSVNKAKLASEYFAKARVMEAQMDTGFQALTSKMEEQLNEAGIDPANIIAQYQEEYNRIKSENKKTLMDKVMDAVKN
jgi:flagellar basal body-associated protein FliL